MRQIVTRLHADADALRRVTGSRGVFDRSGRTSGDDLSYLIDDLVQAADRLSDHLDGRQVTRADLDDVLRRGAEIGNTLDGGSASRQAQNAWKRMQSDLNSLASEYGLNWNWRNPSDSSLEPTRGVDQGLTGTYRLDAARSDDPQRIADQALRQVAGTERARMSRRIQNRLDPPDEIAIERRDRQVSIASSRAPRVTFAADGRQTTEPGRGGRNASTRSTINGDRLEVVTSGNVDMNFTASFEPLDNGQSLRVTKRLDGATIGRPIVVRSVYRRTSDTPEWGIFDDRQPVGTSGRSQYDEGIVPDGTTLRATLDQPVNLRTTQQNDPVTLTVRNAPTRELDDAVIEGYITSAPSQDRSGLSMAFNRIRLRDRRTSSFVGTVENVRGPNGESISFNGGEVPSTDSHQRDQAIQRGAIGAAIGAVIGAVAGGGKGAAIGAVVGAGGGAATVLIGGERASDLPRGTEFTIRSHGSSR